MDKGRGDVRILGIAISGWVAALAIAQSPQLEPGKQVERKIAAGETQRYEIPVQAEQFLRSAMRPRRMFRLRFSLLRRQPERA
jgi:hypothetical protein